MIVLYMEQYETNGSKSIQDYADNVKIATEDLKLSEEKMKKILVIVLVCVLCIMLCSCGNDRTKYYEERISSYEAIAEYALQNYASSDGSRVSIKLSDITENSLSKDIIVAEEKFTYIWIENNSVIFWNDEMKTLGLVYSDNAKSAIKDIEEWYSDLEKEKVNNNCYLIGQLNGI